MKSFRIMTCFLLAFPLVANAGSYLPSLENKHLIAENRTSVHDVFTNNLEKVRNPSIENLASLTENINLVASEYSVAVSDGRETFTKNLEKVHNPSIANMISQAGDIKRMASGNQVAVSETREVFTQNLEKIHNPSITNTISQTAVIKYMVSEIQ